MLLPRFLDVALSRSLFLPFGAAIALVWANTLAASYLEFAHALEFFVNEVGMVFFFALAAKEVVEATLPDGALHTWRRAALPVAAAAGGMVAPAIIYVVYAQLADQPILLRGWAIPCATDIAFSYLIASAIFRRHPAIPFLLLLAIVDDALGLMILALFYPSAELHVGVAVLLMVGAIATADTLRRLRVRSFWPYIVAGGAMSWSALFLGGFHPALALVPIIPFLPHPARDAGLFEEPPAGAQDALNEFHRSWKYPVQGVLFLFGLVNAGVPIQAYGTGTWAVLTALLAGKPLGIGAAVAIAVACGLRLPPRVCWSDILVVGCAAGIGFTVALFFATAAFPPGLALDQVKIGALLSVGSAGLAFAAAAVLKVGRFMASPAERP